MAEEKKSEDALLMSPVLFMDRNATFRKSCKTQEEATKGRISQHA